MSDIELLGLAAMAAGEQHQHLVMYREEWLTSEVAWNPLVNDADALRLAVKLGFCVDALCDSEVRVDALTGHHWTELKGDDIYADTRRAIVQLAAVIGRKMQSDAAYEGIQQRAAGQAAAMSGINPR